MSTAPPAQPEQPAQTLAEPLRATDVRRVRTFSGRQGRMSDLTRARLDEHGPRRQLPAGVLDPVATFGRVAPVVLEVGCGHGAAAVAYARTHPEHDLVAIDVHVPGLARLLAVADEQGVGDNLRVDRDDAVAFLQDRIRPGQLAAVHLLFPDPWPKNRHAKRRFVRQDTLDLLLDRLAPDGAVLVATDIASYAQHVRDQVAAHGGFVVEQTPRPGWRPMAGFERKGVAAGRTVTDLRLTRR